MLLLLFFLLSVESKKYCMDCKHLFTPTLPRVDCPICLNYPNIYDKTYLGRTKGTGRDKTEYVYCTFARTNEEICGLEARGYTKNRIRKPKILDEEIELKNISSIHHGKKNRTITK